MFETETKKNLKKSIGLGLLDGLTPSIKNSISKDDQGKIKIDKIRLSTSVLSYMGLMAIVITNIPHEWIEIGKHIILKYVNN